MEPETKQEIEETVVDILKGADMQEMTEFKVRNLAFEKLGINLSAHEYKQIVPGVVESFLSKNSQPTFCPFSWWPKRRITIQEFRGKTLVSIREY
ncbi:RNA polymerase II transcriptional coactivator KELP-like [Aristolochia californica]|uniref:RNA polymerase II transcriptional coactivator KELP-like n=1 Tax=Aristolochia californica TaxID=171875 RepID=UPI0035E07E4B